MTHRYKLVSFALCPFVQRSVILLTHKQIPHEIEYIDLADKPEWFLAAVPTGKVPALFIGDTVLFESAVINEFLDETTPPPTLASDPIARAKERAWISYAEKLIFEQYHMMIAAEPDEYEHKKKVFIEGMVKLECVAMDFPANEARFNLLDASIAPLFTRTKITASVYQELKITVRTNSPLIRWIDALTAREEVKHSVPENFETAWQDYFQSRNSHYFQVN